MLPTFYINHGGGPCFFLDGPEREPWGELESYLRNLSASLLVPVRAMVVISGHWEEPLPTVNSGNRPQLLFDYGGFPDYTYRLTWPAPGAPEIAAQVRKLLGEAGIESAENAARGWDHGVFVPMKVMFPEAQIPVVQLSLQHGLDAHTHLFIGRALAPLRRENVLIIGSGQSYHNMRGFSGGADRVDHAAEAFDHWLRDAISDGATRDRSLLAWQDAPGAQAAQPYPDHLLPLMVAAGAAPAEPAKIDFHGHILGKPVSGFRFG